MPSGRERGQAVRSRVTVPDAGSSRTVSSAPDAARSRLNVAAERAVTSRSYARGVAGAFLVRP